MIVDELIAVLGYDVKGEANLARFNKGLADTEKRMSAFAVAATAFAAAAAAAVVGGGIALAKSVITTSAQFEGFETALTTIEGSAEKARTSMDWISQFAAETPYELAGVTDAFIKLKAYGIDATDGSLRTLGDAASAMNKPLNAAVEMFADAATFQFERLKEFGITAQTKGDQVTFSWTKNGETMTRVVKKNGDDIRKFILENMGDRFNGAMIRQSKTWNGMMSNLGDSWENFKLRIGRGGFFDFVKGKLGDLLDSIGDLADDGTLDRVAGRIGKVFIAIGQSLLRFGRAVWKLAGWIGEGFDKLGKVIADGLRDISGGEIDLSNMTALGIAAGLLLFIVSPLSGAIVAAGLAIDDFLTYMEGGDSVISPFVDQLKKLDFSTITAALEKVDWSAIGTTIGTTVGHAIVASLVTTIGGASEIAGVIATSLASMNWSQIGNVWLQSMKAQFDLIAGVAAGFAGTIKDKVLEWFNVDLTGIGARWGAQIAAGLASMAATIRAAVLSALPGWAQKLLEDQTVKTAGSDIGAMVPPPSAPSKPIQEDRATRERGPTMRQRAAATNDNGGALDAMLANMNANLAAMTSGAAAGATVTDARQDNRQFPVTVSAPVSVTVTQASQAPAAVGSAISGAIQAGAGAQAARISAESGAAP